MIFPFRTSTIFRNRWVALLWAVGICFVASEVVDSLSGVTAKADRQASAASTRPASDDPVAVALGNAPLPPSPASAPLEDHIAR